jgi:hypothetical protein
VDAVVGAALVPDLVLRPELLERFLGIPSVDEAVTAGSIVNLEAAAGLAVSVAVITAANLGAVRLASAFVLSASGT